MAAGGVPRFVLFNPSAFFLPTFTEAQYIPPSPPVTPAGTITEYSATIGSLTKISGVKHTILGSFPHAGHPRPSLDGPLYPSTQRHLADIDAGFVARRSAPRRDVCLGQLLKAHVKSQTLLEDHPSVPATHLIWLVSRSAPFTGNTESRPHRRVCANSRGLNTFNQKCTDQLRD